MLWSFARALVRNESFFGIMAVVIAVSNAPIFQNIGVDKFACTQKYLIVSFYICLICALLSLFFARLIFELNCPDPIKKSASLDDYLYGIPDNDEEEAQVRSQMTAEWNTANQKEEWRSAISISVYVFLFLFPASFLLAILTLLEFGRS